MRIIKASDSHRSAIIELLKSEKLPTGDLPLSLDNFFVANSEASVIALIGLEIYGKCALLRSMVVRAQYRNKGIASELVKMLEEYAGSIGMNCIYLLTETAADFFDRKGYERIMREEAPKELQASSEFSHVCPASAIVMKKEIRIAN